MGEFCLRQKEDTGGEYPVAFCIVSYALRIVRKDTEETQTQRIWVDLEGHKLEGPLVMTVAPKTPILFDPHFELPGATKAKFCLPEPNREKQNKSCCPKGPERNTNSMYFGCFGRTQTGGTVGDQARDGRGDFQR